jgi:CMP-N,N'-diacetyllegionaminic acid synthase
MIQDLQVAAIIAARGGSKRLPRKNIYSVWGQPMICWTIKSAQHSKYIDDIYVSTEDDEIKHVAEKCGALVIDRPDELADGKTYKQRVICHAFQIISASDKYKTPQLIVSLQANSPDLNPKDVDAAIEKLVDNNRWEILSMDENLLQNGAFRVQRDHVVCMDTLSAVTGAYIVKCSNIHELDDVKELEKIEPPQYD